MRLLWIDSSPFLARLVKQCLDDFPKESDSHERITNLLEILRFALGKTLSSGFGSPSESTAKENPFTVGILLNSVVSFVLVANKGKDDALINQQA